MPEGNITAQTDKRLFVLIDDRGLSASIISVIYSGSLQTAPPSREIRAQKISPLGLHKGGT